MSTRKQSVKQGKRHRARILAFQTIFAWDMSKNTLESLLDFTWMKNEEDEEVLLFAKLLISGFLENNDSIDEQINQRLTSWKLDRLNRVDLAILRTGVYSLLYQKDIPASVSINEAVEMAKEFGTDESYKFVNAVMDGVHKAML